MKALHQGTHPFSALDVADALGREHSLVLRDPQGLRNIAEKFIAVVQEASDNPIVLHGHRIERMFAYVAASLGRCCLVKREDAGDPYTSDSTISIPDYCVVLKSGPIYFVEVKNFHQNSGAEPFTLDQDYLSSLERYASLFGHQLRLAVYWSRWRQWTLLAVEDLSPSGDKLAVSVADAFAANRMIDLGDFMVGTTPPLALRVYSDESKPRAIGKDGRGVFTIKNVAVLAGEKEITDNDEKSLVIYFMLYGRWAEEEPVFDLDGKDLISVEFRVRPEEQSEEQPFEMLGYMSTMIAQRFNDLTTDSAGVQRLTPHVPPGSLAARIPGRVQDMQLPLWVFHTRPRAHE